MKFNELNQPGKTAIFDLIDFKINTEMTDVIQKIEQIRLDIDHRFDLANAEMKEAISNLKVETSKAINDNIKWTIGAFFLIASLAVTIITLTMRH
jgi:hypothetical protein